MMKRLVFILAVLLVFSCQAQDASYGFTGRFGVYKTLVANGDQDDDINYGPGLQLELGTWMRKPIGEKQFLQFSLLHTLERQSGGTLRLIDEQRNPMADVKTRYGNLSVGGTAVYFNQLNDKLYLGAGAGVKYTYVAIMAIQEVKGAGGSMGEMDEYYDNRYHRKLHVYLPLEAQLKLSPRVQLTGQVTLPITNRVAASETAFKERNLGVVLGVNYSLL